MEDIPIENKRVKEVINYYCDGNELLFSKEINVSQPRINRLFSVDSRNNKYPIVSFDIIQSIINKFINVSAEWLLTGKGSMLKQKDHYDKELHEYENKIDEKKEIEIKHLSTQITLYEQSNSLYKELNHEIKTRLEKVEKELEYTKKELEICQGNRTIATRKSELA